MMSCIYYVYYENPVITSSGERVTGGFSHWSLKEESKGLEGEVNQKYLDNITDTFETGIEKEKFADRFGMDFMRFSIASYLLNFPADLDRTSNFSMRFDYDYLKSEKEFYEQYKQGIKSVIRKEQKTIKEQNQAKWFQYTNEQLQQIDRKIDSLESNFKVAYYLGLENVILDFGAQFWLVLVVLAFALSGIFSKDSRNGIDEIALAAANGRKKNMNAKVVAGNLFSVCVYFIFIATTLLLNGVFASLHGLGASVQLLWHTSLYNLSLGTTMLILFGMGFLGTLIIANLVMFISISTKSVKLSTICSIASILLLVELTKTINMLQLQLNPIYFSTSLQLDNPIFIGELMLPYVVISGLIGSIYLIIIRFVTKIQHKKYALRG